MIDEQKCAEILNKITPKYIGARFLLSECPIPLIGDDIKKHLNGCESVLICAATLGEEFDRLLRQLQLTDMAGAVILDSMAGGYLEDFCDEKFGTARYSPGYGDFPLKSNRDIVEALNTSIRIGLCVTDDYILTPQKSITGITGIKYNEQV